MDVLPFTPRTIREIVYPSRAIDRMARVGGDTLGGNGVVSSGSVTGTVHNRPDAASNAEGGSEDVSARLHVSTFD